MAGDEPRRRHPARSSIARDFYGSALDRAERIELAAAHDVEGLDDEIAVLRMKLRTALAEHPDDLALTLRAKGSMRSTAS